MQTQIKTENRMFDTFYERIKSFLEQDVSEYTVESKKIRGYRSPDTTPIWLRDHTHQMKGFKYFEKDMKSAATHFIERQMPDGLIYDTVNEEGKNHRAPCEADVEYLLIEAAYTVWQVTGDEKWVKWALPFLQKALYYSMSSPIRWSKKYQLVKRPFTIDTWDFVYNPDGIYRFGSYGDIDATTSFCIMHGDNTGMYQSCIMLSKLYDYFGNVESGEYWKNGAQDFKERINKVCWNGKFFTHQVHIDPIEVKGVNEKEQLSLSNAYALNRGILTHEQATSIIKEYIKRKEETRKEYFAEWFSIHPPFPDYSFHAKNHRGWCINRGWYVNGGILPLVGGELAKGAFENGFEEYGLDILKRYYEMISKAGETYLWYHPDGTPGKSSPSTLATDGWGSAAMLSAYIEGLVGVKDEFKLFQKVMCSPRWAITQEKTVKTTISYEVSNTYFSYEYSLNENDITIDWQGNNTDQVYFHVLLPTGKAVIEVNKNNRFLTFQKEKVENSSYVNFKIESSSGKVIVKYK